MFAKRIIGARAGSAAGGSKERVAASRATQRFASKVFPTTFLALIRLVDGFNCLAVAIKYQRKLDAALSPTLHEEC